MYHGGKELYYAIVGTPVGADLMVLGSLENHSTHRGWHVHAACKSVSASNSGRLRYQEMKRMKAGGATYGAIPFPSDDVAAIEIAARYFKLPPLANEAAVQVPMVYQSGGAL